MRRVSVVVNNTAWINRCQGRQELLKISVSRTYFSSGEYLRAWTPMEKKVNPIKLEWNMDQ